MNSGKPTTRRVTYDPLTELMAHYAGRKSERKKESVRAASVEDRLKNRIIDGDKVGLPADLDEGLKQYSPLDIINTILLEGMKVVGELFGSGQMQLPFVLQSAEVMKTAVAYLEPHMDKASVASKGTMVIATVKGDVHDIGKNLVDIILTNNGFTVVNLGIKCPIESILTSAGEHRADAIGMSGLLVKSTLIMKENLEVMNEREDATPVILGGAALTRKYVETDLQGIYRGEVRYARDAFDGLRFMEKIMAGEKAGSRSEGLPAGKNVGGSRRGEAGSPAGARRMSGGGKEDTGGKKQGGKRSDTRTDIPIPEPPFLGTRVVTDISLEDVFRYVNDVALIRGQWQVKKGKLTEEEYRTMLQERVYPDYERLKKEIVNNRLLQPAVVYGYFPCRSDGNDVIIYHEDSDSERLRFTFPRQSAAPFLCLADFFASVESGKTDVIGLQLVTMGAVASDHSSRLFEADNYKEYLYFHGLSVEGAEALAELWHKNMRQDLGIHGRDATEIRRLFSQGYQGSRYSFGYPACPNLEDQVKVMELLQGETIGVTLSDEFQLVPEQSTTAMIVHHPQARYFTVKGDSSS